ETKEATIKIKVNETFTGEVDKDGEDIITEKTFEIKFNTEELIVSATKITLKITEYNKTIADFSTDLGVANLENVSTPTEIKIEKLEKFFDIDNGVDGATYSIKDMVETNDGNYGFKLIVSEVYDEDGETATNVEEKFAIKTNPSYVAPIMLVLDESDFAMINPDWVGSEEYKEWDGTLVIPKRINGTMFQIKPAPLPGSSFASSIKDDLKHLIIEGEKYDGIDSIPQYAFYECKNLESVEVSDGYTNLKSIYVGAFNGCTNLKTFDFTNITSFGNEAFKNAGLTGEIELNKEVALNSQSIFKGCDKLDSITVIKSHAKNLSQEYGWAGGYWNGIPANQIGSNIKTYPIDQFDYSVYNDTIRIKSITNDYADEIREMNKDGTWDGVITFPGEIDGKRVSAIERAFKDNKDLGVKKLVFTQPVSISGTLGVDLPEVTEMVGTKNITSIDEGAFKDMRKLEGTVDLSNLRETGANMSIPNNAFENCEKLENVIVPNLLQVGNSAFENCASFKPTQKFFFKRLNKIGGRAFAGCTSLTTEVDISRTSDIGWEAFENCTGLTGNIYLRAFNDRTLPGRMFKGCDPTKLNVQIHQGVYDAIEAEISNHQMQDESGLSGYELVEREEYLFSINLEGEIDQFNDAWLENVPTSMQPAWENGIINVPEYIDNIKVEKITRRKINAAVEKSTLFYKTDKVDYSVIKGLNFAPGGLKEIAIGSFADLVNLESVSGLDNVGVAEDYAFNNCKVLEDVDFSDNLNDIKEGAFRECRSLKNVETKNVTSIGQDAFYYNYSFNPVATSFLNVEKLANAFHLKYYDSRETEYGEIFETIGWQNDVSFPKLNSTLNASDWPFVGITTGITIGLPSKYYETADGESNSSLMFRFVGDIVNTDDASAETKTLTHEKWLLNPNPGQKPTSKSVIEIFETFLKGKDFYNISKKD
ncbi:MAG: leucine-rich repeat domain-containing protein, partial [Mycoplasma sp.]